MRSSFLAPLDVIEFQATDKCSSLDVTSVIYNLYRHPRDEMVEIILRTVRRRMMMMIIMQIPYLSSW
jgi:hypothetical protein